MDLSESEIEDALVAMDTYGGGFVRKLAILYRQGDPYNRTKLRKAFEGYFIEYDGIAKTWGKKEVEKEIKT